MVLIYSNTGRKPDRKFYQDHWNDSPSEYPTAPPGVYVAVLKGLRGPSPRPTKNGPRGFIRAIFEVVQGEHQGKTAYWEGWFTEAGSPTKATKAFFNALGISPFDPVDSSRYYQITILEAETSTTKSPWRIISEAVPTDAPAALVIDTPAPVPPEQQGGAPSSSFQWGVSSLGEDMPY